MDRWKTKKFRHKPTEVIATSFDTASEGREGVLDLADFPIKITAVDTGQYNVDGLSGPMPLYEVNWTEGTGLKRETIVPHNTVFLAHQYSNSDGFYLTFKDYDGFFQEYEPID